MKKSVFYTCLGIACLIFLFSAGMYLTRYEMVEGFYEGMGFPTWIIYPSAVAKILGVIAIVSNKSRILKEWAYAGFFFDASLATAGHYFAGHGIMGLSLIALITLLVARVLDHRY